ncbi:hypothetical protein DPMN_136006 [Dreissena polymorpha]|uniref:Secreted protein n=1 Tax=Dreissena polymorpha TaxID=45954 RepID=A0A9D4G1Y8_DREPO|nr:hypothetical protein DPMN_136006 [Dreissena polymorpha]
MKIAVVYTCAVLCHVTAQMTSEQGSFGQLDVQPRRGRIVARVLSSDLNITLLHKQAAERYGHLATNESVTSTSGLTISV